MVSSAIFATSRAVGKASGVPRCAAGTAGAPARCERPGRQSGCRRARRRGAHKMRPELQALFQPPPARRRMVLLHPLPVFAVPHGVPHMSSHVRMIVAPYAPSGLHLSAVVRYRQHVSQLRYMLKRNGSVLPAYRYGVVVVTESRLARHAIAGTAGVRRREECWQARPQVGAALIRSFAADTHYAARLE